MYTKKELGWLQNFLLIGFAGLVIVALLSGCGASMTRMPSGEMVVHSHPKSAKEAADADYNHALAEVIRGVAQGTVTASDAATVLDRTVPIGDRNQRKSVHMTVRAGQVQTSTPVRKKTAEQTRFDREIEAALEMFCPDTTTAQ